MKITEIRKIGLTMYAHVCPLCGRVLASASDADLLPEYSICGCDRNGNRQEVYELYEQDGDTMIRRNKPPRFIGRVVFGTDTDIEVMEVLDETNASELAKAMRKAGEFLIKKSRK